MQLHRPMSPLLVAAFNTVMAARTIHCVYQPIVSLTAVEPTGAGQQIIGYEALARGPAGTTWATPEELVGYAAQVGRLPELDWICRAAACRGALAAHLPSYLPVFVNVEPASSRTPCPSDLVDVIEEARQRLQIVAEITERSLAADPAGLLDALTMLRGHSNRIALDDVGVDPASQAMMSLVQPDVIKLDRSVVRGAGTAPVDEIIEAVRAEAVRTGAAILAEGIETEQDLAVARSIGATLGQGWLFGRPGPLPQIYPPETMTLPQRAMPQVSAATPFEVAIARVPATITGEDVLISVSRRLEDAGVHAAEPTVLLTAFQQSSRFDEATRARYSALGAHGILTAAFGHGMPAEPAPHVRGCPLPADDPLGREWDVIVIGSKFVCGMFARQRTDAQPGSREFDLIVSEDRDLVLAAARPLLRRLGPIADSL